MIDDYFFKSLYKCFPFIEKTLDHGHFLRIGNYSNNVNNIKNK